MLGRPASAYFNNTNASNATTMPTQVPMPYMMQSNNNIGPPQAHQTLTMNNRQKNAFIRDSQSQQSLRGMTQMMAPSMPNIAHSSGYATNISSSQSMQNVNMIHPNNNGLNYHNYMPAQPGAPNQAHAQAQAQYMYQQDMQQQQLQHNSLARGQSKLLEMGEMLKRRQQRQQDMMPMHSLDVSGQPTGPLMLSPTGSQNDHHHPQQQQHLNHGPLPKGQPGLGYMQNSSMSPVKQLPPTAPKPQINRQPQFTKEELSPPLPPSATHPLFKTVPGNNGPNQHYAQTSIPPPKNFAGSNPWEREEREKEVEIRREQSRQWREYQISELSTQQHRSPQQEEQLKTLILERDFERLAQAQEQNELEDEAESQYAKDNQYKEVIRLAQSTSINQMAAPVTSMKQIDVKTSVVSQTSSASGAGSSFDSTVTALGDPSFVSAQPAQISNMPSGQPKSILKHNNARSDGVINNSNPSSPSKQAKSTSFAVDRQENATANAVSQVARDLNSLNFNDFEPNSVANNSVPNYPNHEQRKDENNYDIHQNNSSAGPPPPPERNSSYVIMSQKQQNLRNSVSGPAISAQTALTKTTTTASASAITTISEQQQQQTQNANFIATNKKPLPNNNNNNINAITNAATTNGNGNSNGNGISNANIANNNGPTTNNNQSVSQLSLSAMMANRDNKRVSFHDEENNYMGGSTSANDLADFDAIREDPNVSESEYNTNNIKIPDVFHLINYVVYFLFFYTAIYPRDHCHITNAHNTRG